MSFIESRVHKLSVHTDETMMTRRHKTTTLPVASITTTIIIIIIIIIIITLPVHNGDRAGRETLANETHHSALMQERQFRLLQLYANLAVDTEHGIMLGGMS